MKRMAVRTLVRGTFLALPIALCAPGARAADDPAAGLDSLVRQAFASGASPGLSVAVVRGSNVWAMGYGITDTESGRPVLPGTRFYIASTTKALTALAAARLAETGTLDLEAPLARALQGARFPLAYAADSVRVRDLLTHTHGLDPKGPITIRVSFTGEYTQAELLQLLGRHGLAKAGRAFQYSNLGYELAGIVMAPGDRDGWKRIIEREVLEPLRMWATEARRSDVPSDSLAMPHEMGPDRFERVALQKDDANLGPAGGHFSTPRDLARLLLAELHQGHVDGRQVIPAAVIADTQRRHAIQDRKFSQHQRDGWGLGWDLASYEGDRILTRFGTFSGYFSHLSFMPEHELGVVVLANGGRLGGRLADLVANAIYDHMRGRPDAHERLTAWLAELAKDRGEFQAAQAADRAQRAARSQTLRLPLAAYAGRYVNEDLGTLALEVADGRLVATMGVARSAVEVFDATTDRLRVELLGSGAVIEARIPAGDVVVRALQFEGATFVRQ